MEKPERFSISAVYKKKKKAPETAHFRGSHPPARLMFYLTGHDTTQCIENSSSGTFTTCSSTFDWTNVATIFTKTEYHLK